MYVHMHIQNNVNNVCMYIKIQLHVTIYTIRSYAHERTLLVFILYLFGIYHLLPPHKDEFLSHQWYKTKSFCSSTFQILYVVHTDKGYVVYNFSAAVCLVPSYIDSL